MLHLMFFALIVGIAITLIPVSVTAPFLRGLEALYEITAKIIEIIMKFAPYAVACLLFNNTARFGLDLLQALAWFVLTVILGLSLHMFGVYSLSIYFLSRISPIEFFRRVKTVILTAFSTSSSNATLPTALRVSEENLGVPQEINSFVLTVGATANQNGTALYEGVTVLFLAQLAGVDLSVGQQLMVVYLAILGGIGTAGVPSGSIPFIIGVLVTIGVNPALIAIILGVDRILDMCRTTLNVTGDLTAATFVARSEGYELLRQHEPAIVHAGVNMPTRATE
jgi:dicarboxylate/amino acid:cation (Na+ or H+) symporter, DAACS family